MQCGKQGKDCMDNENSAVKGYLKFEEFTFFFSTKILENKLQK